MANHSLVIFKKEVIKADTFLVVFVGVMTLLILIINNQSPGGVAQGFNAQQCGQHHSGNQTDSLIPFYFYSCLRPG